MHDCYRSRAESHFGFSGPGFYSLTICWKRVNDHKGGCKCYSSKDVLDIAQIFEAQKVDISDHTITLLVTIIERMFTGTYLM